MLQWCLSIWCLSCVEKPSFCFGVGVLQHRMSCTRAKRERENRERESRSARCDAWAERSRIAFSPFRPAKAKTDWRKRVSAVRWLCPTGPQCQISNRRDSKLDRQTHTHTHRVESNVKSEASSTSLCIASSPLPGHCRFTSRCFAAATAASDYSATACIATAAPLTAVFFVSTERHKSATRESDPK